MLTACHYLCGIAKESGRVLNDQDSVVVNKVKERVKEYNSIASEINYRYVSTYVNYWMWVSCFHCYTNGQALFSHLIIIRLLSPTLNLCLNLWLEFVNLIKLSFNTGTSVLTWG